MMLIRRVRSKVSFVRVITSKKIRIALGEIQNRKRVHARSFHLHAVVNMSCRSYKRDAVPKRLGTAVDTKGQIYIHTTK